MICLSLGVMNLKERLTVQIEPDMRRGTVRFDGWVLPAKNSGFADNYRITQNIRRKELL